MPLGDESSTDEALRHSLDAALPGQETREGLAVAVSGHRWNNIDMTIAPVLHQRLAEVFAAIDSVGRCPVGLFTGMAEGADLLAAAARPKGWRLHAVLPLSIEDWRAHLAANAAGDRDLAVRSFDEAMSGGDLETTILPPANGGEPDYSALCDALVARADLLVAVWNGEPGKRGGTGDVVAAARRRHLPVIHIPAAGELVGEAVLL